MPMHNNLMHCASCIFTVKDELYNPNLSVKQKIIQILPQPNQFFLLLELAEQNTKG